MMKKRIRKLLSLSLLITARQIWGLLCNLYLLTYQPYLTIKNLREKRDKSQTALLAGAALTPALIYFGGRMLWDKYRYGVVMPGYGSVFLGMAVVETTVLIYLAYWTWRVMREEG